MSLLPVILRWQTLFVNLPVPIAAGLIGCYNDVMKHVFLSSVILFLFASAACQSERLPLKPPPSAPPTPAPSSTFITSIPEFTFLPHSTARHQEESVSEYGIVGEWAGYISQSKWDYVYSKEPTYAAKLTINEDGAWLSLDKLQPEFDWWKYVEGPFDNCGARLKINSMGVNVISFAIEDYAYQQQSKPPFPAGRKFNLLYYHFANDEERKDSEIAQFTPAPGWWGTNDMLYGRIGKWTVSLARLADGPGKDHTYPYWYHGYDNFTDGVRGAYGFGERGADNDLSTLVFVYEDEKGFEHIRLCYGDFYRPKGLEGTGVLAASWGMTELGTSASTTPYWDTLYAFDVKEPLI